MKTFVSKALRATLAAAMVLFTFSAAAQAKYNINYGNNLDLTPASNYASQYRFTAESEMPGKQLTPETDIPAGVAVEWSVELKQFMNGTRINAKTGVITLARGGFRPASSGLVIVTALVGKGTPDAVTVKVPVFFNFAAPNPVTEALDFSYTIQYTPFVLQVNPKTGGKGEPAKIVGEDFDAGSFSLDYRRAHRYFNLYGPAGHDGALVQNETEKGKMLYQVWDASFTAAKKEINTAAKRPVSYFENIRNLAAAACYVDNADGYRVVVNPGKWVDSTGVYANGIYLGQMTYTNQPDGTDINKGQTADCYFIWFDEKF